MVKCPRMRQGHVVGFSHGTLLRQGLLGIALLCDAACSASTEVTDAHAAPCSAGTSIACACVDGRAGTQDCGSNGAYGSCRCSNTDAGVEASDASDAPLAMDSGADGAPPLDAAGGDASADGSRDGSGDGQGRDAMPDGVTRSDAGWQVFGGGLSPGGVVPVSVGTGFAVRAQGFTSGSVSCAGSFCLAGGIVP